MNVCNKLECFGSGRPFQPSLIFESKARAYLSSLLGRFLALPTNITRGWKGIPGTNTLAYYDHS
jgi:hypothetical protein